VIWPDRAEHHRRPLVGHPYAVVEIALGRQRSSFRMRLPAAGGAAFFQCEVDVRWEVFDPHLAAKARVSDVAHLLEPELHERLREVSRRFPITEAASAHDAMKDRIASGVWEPFGADMGLDTQVFVRIDLDQRAIDQLNEIGNERHGAQLADARHRRVSVEERLEAERVANRAGYFRVLVDAGDHAQAAYMMAKEPEAAKQILHDLRDERRADRRETLEFFAHLVDRGMIDRWQLGEHAEAVMDFMQQASDRMLDTRPPHLALPGSRSGPGEPTERTRRTPTRRRRSGRSTDGESADDEIVDRRDEDLPWETRRPERSDPDGPCPGDEPEPWDAEIVEESPADGPGSWPEDDGRERPPSEPSRPAPAEDRPNRRWSHAWDDWGQP
jgi:hypothetical protein